MNDVFMFLTCDKKLTKSQLSPTHVSTKRKITDELKHKFVIAVIANSKARFPLLELTARVDGWPVSITLQHGPC